MGYFLVVPDAAGLDEATMEKWRAAALERFELEAERS